jgi:hypothetical protein
MMSLPTSRLKAKLDYIARIAPEVAPLALECAAIADAMERAAMPTISGRTKHLTCNTD